MRRRHHHLHRLPAAAGVSLLLLLPAAPGWATADTLTREQAGPDTPAVPHVTDAGAGLRSVATAAQDGSPDMDGMDGMDGMDDMAGMDHGSAPTRSEGPHDMDQMAGMNHDDTSSPGDEQGAARPSLGRARMVVLTAFGAVNAAVLLTAARRRRTNRLRPRRHQGAPATA
ncbi:hypothetical protein [Cellulomonas sp. URHB0016]